MMPVNYVKPFLLEEFDVAGLAAGFAPVNAGGTADNLLILRINNHSNTAVIISYDGVHDHDIIGIGASVVYNLQSNSEPQNWVYQLKQGTTFYVRGTAGVGFIYFSGWY
jgi:hypothetical protein